MSIPVLGILVAIVTLVVFWVQKRRSGRTWKEFLLSIGWKSSTPNGYVLGLIFGVLGVGIGWVLIHTLPPEIQNSPNISLSAYTGIPLGPMLFVIVAVQEGINTLAEEVLYRGLLGSWLVRRLGFQVGNAIQAALFLLPHTALLLISIKLWPLTILQAVAGWVMGWLRNRSDSIFPGWLAHAITNIGTALITTLKF